MAELLLIRHGQASFGAADYDQLSGLGERQSRLLGEWLRHATPPALIACGRLLRHRQTAEHCLQAAALSAPRLELAGLDELDHRELLARLRPDLLDGAALRAELKRDPQPRRAFQRLFVEAVSRWSGGSHDAEYRQSWPAFRAATLDALATLAAHPAKQIWAFTSGGPIAVIVNHVLDAPVERCFELSWPLVNTSLTHLSLSRQGPRLTGYNGWPHLQQAGEPGLITYR